MLVFAAPIDLQNQKDLNMITARLTILGILLCLGRYAAADELLGPAETKMSTPLRVGAALAYKGKPYKGYDDDEQWAAAPLVIYEGEHFFFRGTSTGWKFINQDDFEFDVRVEARLDGYDSHDSNALRGMDDRDPSVDGGLGMTWRPGGGPLSFDLVAVGDLGDKSDGYEVRAGGSYVVHNGSWATRLGAFVVYDSDDMVDYYYGVKQSEAIPGRPAYSPDGEAIFRVQALTAYRFSESRWMAYFGGRYDFLGDEITDSPIVGDDYQYILMTGFTYTFGG